MLYTSHVANIPPTQAAIAAVESQPRARSHPLTTNSPIIFRCAAISIRMTMTGTATTPLITALGPRDAEPELSPGLAVGADPGGIIVGGAGNQTGTQNPKQARLAYHW